MKKLIAATGIVLAAAYAIAWAAVSTLKTGPIFSTGNVAIGNVTSPAGLIDARINTDATSPIGMLFLGNNFTGQGFAASVGVDAAKNVHLGTTSANTAWRVDTSGGVQVCRFDTKSGDTAVTVTPVGAGAAAEFDGRVGVNMTPDAADALTTLNTFRISNSNAVLRVVADNATSSNFIESGSSGTSGTAVPLKIANMSGAAIWAQWDASGNFTENGNATVNQGTETITSSATNAQLFITNTSTGGRSFIISSGGNASAVPNALQLVDGTGGTTRQFWGATSTTINNLSTDTLTLHGATSLDSTLTSTAGTNTLGKLVENIQTTSSSSGALVNDFALGANTLLLKWNASTAVPQWTGMAGGADGRVVFVVNTGSVSIQIYTANANSAAANRFNGDGGTGGLYLTTGSVAMMTYEGTSSLWDVSILDLTNTPGNFTVNGTLGTISTISDQGSLVLQNGTADQYFLTTTTNSSIDIDANGTGAVRFNTNNGGVTNSGTGGLELWAGNNSSTKLWTVDGKAHVHAIAGGTPVLSSCGTSPTIVGNDNAFRVTTGSAATTCTITFATAYATNAPVCTVWPEGATTLPTCTVTTTAITCTVDVASSKYSWVCYAPN